LKKNFSKNHRKLFEKYGYENIKIENNQFYIDLFIGKNNQEISFILDTTSQITTTICDKVSNEKILSEYKNNYKLENKSQIIKCKDEKCSFVYSDFLYCENEEKNCSFTLSNNKNSSIEGIYINEYISFNKKEKGLIQLGCIKNENNFLKEKSGKGILGLGSSKYNFISNYIKNNNNNNNYEIFSICFDKINGGYFSLGRINETFHSKLDNITYINYNIFGSYYNIKINYLEFGDEKHFNFNITYNSFLDSTYSYSIFPKAVYNYLFQSINKLYFIDNKNIKIIKHDNFLCFDSNKNLNNIINQLPPFRIIFEKNGIFFWRSNNYINYINGKYCLGILEGNDNNFIFGNNFMFDYDFIFNLKEKKIGFIKSFCSMNEQLLYKECCNYHFYHFFFIIIIIILILINLFLFFVIRKLRKKESFLCFKYIGNNLLIKNFHNAIITSYNKI
jgi:hypothetical protein